MSGVFHVSVLITFGRDDAGHSPFSPPTSLIDSWVWNWRWGVVSSPLSTGFPYSVLIVLATGYIFWEGFLYSIQVGGRAIILVSYYSGGHTRRPHFIK